MLEKGQLSPFIGAWEIDTEFGGFFGGSNVYSFERAIESLLAAA